MPSSYDDTDDLASPSFNDTEAASQQLLAEASSPVRRQTAAPINASAILGANLLNHARTLTKPPATAPPALKEKAGRLTKPVQLRPTQLRNSGKLARASLSSLVGEGPSKKVRGEKMYEIGPSPQKKRPHSLPSQNKALESEGSVEGRLVAQKEDAMVPETSQAQAEEHPPVDDSGDHAPVSANGQIEQTSVTQDVLLEEPFGVSAKKRGRTRKSGERTASTPLPEAGTGQDQHPLSQNFGADEDVNIEHLPSSPPELPPQEETPAATKNRRGPPRKSGESTTSTRLSDAGESSRQEKTESSALVPRLKRKARTEWRIDLVTDNESIPDEAPARKQRRLKGPVTISPDVPEFDENLVASKFIPHDASLRSDLRSATDIPIRASRSRTTIADAEGARGQEHPPIALITAKTRSASHPSRSTRLAKTSSVPERPAQDGAAGSRRPTRKAARNGKQVEEVPQDVSNEPTVDHDQLISPHSDAESDGESDGDRGEGVGEDSDQDQDDRDNQDRTGQDNEGDKSGERGQPVSNSANAEQTMSSNTRQPSPLDTVFVFADSEERSGVCSTSRGRTIHRRCDRFRVILSRQNLSLKDITKCKDHFVETLQSIPVQVKEERRYAFKRDVYAYLFRDLTVVLRAMHNKMQDRQGDSVGSLDYMQIVYPFIRAVLQFKDGMDSWKVAVHSRTKGDRLIKNVESGLISPLRVAERELGRHFQQMLKAEKDRKAAIEAQREREEAEHEAIRREELLGPVKERRKRWQELHIVRMQCEPDTVRRRKLRFVEPAQVAEIDADGQPFERVPFFGERSAPPPQCTAVSSNREWTNEQEIALLDALQAFSSLERIFAIHCGPRGVLRDFSVSDFAAKLAWVRSAWAQLSQQHGWEVPEWVKSIPVLP